MTPSENPTQSDDLLSSAHTETARHNVRCYPTVEQQAQLTIEFEACRLVYNLSVEMARHAYAQGEPYPGEKGFKKAITQWKKTTDWSWSRLASVQCLQWAAKHADSAFKHFFRRCKAKQEPGFPRFKKAAHEASATYNIVHCRWSEQTGELVLSKQKTPLKIRWDRRGTPQQAKSVTIRRDAAGRYFASFTCQKAIEQLPAATAAVGIDIGVTHALALSTGELVDAPAFLSPQRQRRLLHLQRKLARQDKKSHSRERTRKAIARLHARMADSRTTWQHKITRSLVMRFQAIAFEDLNIKAMTRSPAPQQDPATQRYLPNRSSAKARLHALMLNVAPASLRSKIEYKAKWGARQTQAVNPAYTSQKCARCGHISAENRKKTRFLCVKCGYIEHADVNAAKNILAHAFGA
jgi:putative transposase